MIYWPQNTDIETRIPNVLGVTEVDSPHLTIINNVGRSIWEGSVSLSRITPLYFTMELMTFDEAPAGEYTYRLTDGETTLSEGLLIIGEYVTERDEYKKTIEYEQY